LVLILEIIVASVAVVLVILSVKTMQAIKHLGVGKSFWTPVTLSGFLFFFGSTTAILFELNFSLTTYTDEVVQISRLLALSTLVVGVYSYARTVSKNLSLKTSKEAFEKSEVETVAASAASVAPIAPAPPATIQERLAEIEENQKREASQECKYHFGYLKTLPRHASIPDECLSCCKIIECKHSLVKNAESTSPLPNA
jgi:hypothetical protein